MLCKLTCGGMVWSATKITKAIAIHVGEIEAKAKIEAEVDGHEAISVPYLGYDCFSCACCKCLCDFFPFVLLRMLDGGFNKYLTFKFKRMCC